MSHATLVQHLGLVKNPSTLVNEVLVIFLGSVFLAACAQLAIPLPYSPVPVTAQTLAVLLIGASFGAKRAFICTITYLLEGFIGLPVFAGATFGFAKLFGPTGGYLIGFVLAATLMGYISERRKTNNLKSALVIFLLGHIVIYFIGIFWLSFFVGSKNALAMGLFPFIPGAIIKTTLASFLLPMLWKIR